MNKSKQENRSTRNSNCKVGSGKGFHRRNKKGAKTWKEQTDDPQADLKLKVVANGVSDRKNQANGNMQKKSFVRGKSSVIAEDKSRKNDPRNKTTLRKEFVQKSERFVTKAGKTNAASSPKSDGIQKRKAQNSGEPGTKPKKPKNHFMSESDSDANDYMEQFFKDVLSEQKVSTVDEVPTDESDEEDDDQSTESSSEESDSDTDEDEGNAMSLEQLIDYYGQRRDDRDAEGKTDKKRKPSKSSHCSNNNTWIEEDNDLELVYDNSDDEKGSSSLALVPVGNVENAEYGVDEDQDSSLDESVEEEEDEDSPFDLEAYLKGDYDSADDTIDSDEEDDTSGSDYTGSSSLDGYYEEEESDQESSSDYDSDEDEDDDSLDDSEEDYDDEDEYTSYWDESYDSEDDDDYIAEEDDDLYISRGAARVYNIDDNEVSFNSDLETAQIVELPIDDRRSKSVGSSGTDSQEDGGNNEGCPALVPIYDMYGNLIDSPEKLEELKLQKEVNERNRKSSCSELDVDSELNHKVSSQLDVSPDLDHQSTMEEDVEQNNATNTSYRFYDSIDMRISLLVLKETLYFSGHLTVQPLIGGLEVMGYNLRSGECRSVFAARGFHCLNLTPRAQGSSISKDMMDKVINRVEKHFHEDDLKEIQNSFDGSNSVLVLLQADCSNKRVETVDKYLPEDFLFPKVEFLKKSIFFRTEYLLNVEFYSENVDKCTSLYRPDPEWNKIVVRNNSKLVVIGGKGSGKSTLCQYLVNKNVQKFKKVVLIDLDIGQPIQHIPETISITIVDRPLLGVATFDPIPPAKSWLFGSLDIVSSLIFYTHNVRQLVRYCEQHKSELANIPWVINTMGYVSDFGEELMATILRMFCPTDVIQLVCTEKSFAIPNFQNRLTSEFINQYNYNILRSEAQEFTARKANFKHYELNVCYPKKGFTLNAPKRRNLMLLAHLADILQDSSSEWFNEVKPFCAPLSQLQVLITREDQTLGEDQLPSVLNATLVYLCRKIVDSELYECLGIGIVRGVDKNNNVYLLQSLPDKQLADVNVLAICSSSLPNAAFLRQSSRIQGSIPYVYNID
ncbi:polynucleotide 5'-hydroxyl-kinase NOL9 [Armigeres subalbatus]|uniref:polynucleotide 5'-hydroxyl-kinase NOL9 n=1 Tax=Armigeres subalbatus TaxID=124917 RepID=UPI002ED0DF16